MNSFWIGGLLLIVIVGTVNSQQKNQQVTDYLIENGYLQESYTKHELRRALRQLQRENNLTISGRISSQTIDFIQTENNRQMVLDYLKTFGYIQGSITPLKTTNAIKQLQQNSGSLSITGFIDTPTVEFIKNHPQAYSEGLMSS